MLGEGRAEVVNGIPDRFLEGLLFFISQIHTDFHLHGRCHFRNVKKHGFAIWKKFGGTHLNGIHFVDRSL